MWSIIQDYVFNTHGKTHHFKVELIDIYELNRHNEPSSTKTYCDKIGNKHLLWHGSGMVNFCSILKNGFYIDAKALKGVYITGKMFGGSSVYTANTFSKSMGYTRSELSDNYGALLLCEVALGRQAKRVQADYTCGLEKLAKENCDSCWGQGKYAPSSNTILDNGVIVPNGLLKETGVKTVLMYDEMIVYNTDQLSMKYLVIVKKNN
jgi:poly [ADP-ribose] polymerase